MKHMKSHVQKKQILKNLIKKSGKDHNKQASRVQESNHQSSHKPESLGSGSIEQHHTFVTSSVGSLSV